MASIGGSPLNLIYTSFPADENQKNRVTGYNSQSKVQSIFQSETDRNSSKRTFEPWPLMKSTGNQNNGIRQTLHSDDVYDISLNKIIENSQKVSLNNASQYPIKLSAMDFAYLKNVGVYPNNRLMVARRYPSSVGDDFTRIPFTPLSTLISWHPESEDFLSMTFGEVWEDADVDFKSVLDELGKDFMGKDAGGITGGGAGVIPLPGFTEIFQRQVFSALGIFDKDSAENIPAGNPNLIKQARQRKLIKDEASGSGLTCNVSIKMVCEWEQKFIQGVDPTIVFLDIIHNVLNFGTSESITYGLSGGMNQKFKDFLDLMEKSPLDAIKKIVKAIGESVGKIIDQIKEAMGVNGKPKEEVSDVDKGNLAEKMIKGMLNVGESVLIATVKKYKIRLIGISNALSGAPSTPWHITIGNPMRPIFCSGDMECTDVTLTLGPTLAFNDLPSTIKAEFTLKNARPWGAQEILSKFSSGHVRISEIKPNIYTADEMSEFVADQNQSDAFNVSQKKGSGSINTNGQPQGIVENNQSGDSDSDFDDIGGGVAATGNSGKSIDGNRETQNAYVNPDANDENLLIA
jgi:hypothetical protein